MSEQKDIDKLFQEKFKDFETEPPQHTWPEIKFKLEGKNERRKIIPFWWKLSGIAAALVIGTLIVTTMQNETDSKIVFDDINKRKENNNNPLNDEKIIDSNKSIVGATDLKSTATTNHINQSFEMKIPSYIKGQMSILKTRKM